MMKRAWYLLGLTFFVIGFSAGLAVASRRGAVEGPQTKALLDNRRVSVTELTMAPGARREPYTRPSDQIIVFIDKADYQAVDAEGKQQARHRAAGEIIWHDKGEAAPLLINVGKRPYRNLVVALK